MIHRREFENSTDAVAEARSFATEHVREGSPELTRALGLMVSELATNCVRHTTSAFTVEIEQTAGEVRVRVSDRGEGKPVIRSPGANEPSGRGLGLVETLADSFGVDYDARGVVDGTGGKTVWFALRLPATVNRSGERASGESASGRHPTELGSTAGRPAESEVAEPTEDEPPGLVTEGRQRAAESRGRRERFRYRCTCHSFLPGQYDRHDSSHVIARGNSRLPEPCRGYTP